MSAMSAVSTMSVVSPMSAVSAMFAVSAMSAVSAMILIVCERSLVTGFQLSSPDAIYNQDRRRRGNSV